ncbi:MAG: hypothetical protein SGJ11_06795 [Phycisphaerae bacterium]|nr:hypothetical protein [Phycisphaerae bacterium]
MLANGGPRDGSDSHHTNPHHPVDGSFEASARQITGDLRQALSRVLLSVGADPSRPQDVSRQFGLNKNLTWKVSKVIGDDAPQVAVTHLPGRPGLAILLRRMEEAGAPPECLAALRSAIAALDDLVATHAGDRETLAVMLASLGERAAPLVVQRDEVTRKLAFQGNSAIWGTASRVQLNACFVLPSADADRLAFVVVAGFVDFRRLRPDVTWPLATLRGCERGAMPIDATVAAGGVPFMSAFCSRPLPSVRAVPTSQEGTTRFELTHGPVGITAATTCMLGCIDRASLPRWGCAVTPCAEHHVALTTPAEIAILDVFVHRSIAGSSAEGGPMPTASLYGQLPERPAYPQATRADGRLHLSEAFTPLQGAAWLGTDVPKYTSIVAAVCAAAGADPGDLHGYRLQLRYPPMPSLAVIEYVLPQRTHQ